MTNKLTSYTKLSLLRVAVTIFIFVHLTAQSVTAQTPPSNLTLLAWSPDGAFLLGVTPGQIVARNDGTTQQSQIIWRLSVDDSASLRLAEGFDVQLSPDGRFVTFIPLNAQNGLGLQGIDVRTGGQQPLQQSILSTPATPLPADPPGRVYISPDGKQRAIVINEFFKAELWIGKENRQAELVLKAKGEVFSDLAWHPNNQAVALIRTPLGSQSESAGDLWRVDLDSEQARRLSQNNVVDRSPVWRAATRQMAVVRNDRWIIIPADELLVEQFTVEPPAMTTPPAVSAQGQLTPPSTIRVIHHAGNTCRNVPVGQIDTIPFEAYVKRVVPHEVLASWPAETLKAQAVAARTYGWDKYRQDPAAAYHVTDWVNHQYMCDNTDESTNEAVADTRGEYLAYNGEIITAMFSAENSSPTRSSPFVGYLKAIDDPVSFGQPRNGHGYGMGQWGAQRWAAQHAWSYQAILRHYYTGVTIEEPGGFEVSPPNVSIVTPWSNHYHTSNRLHLLVNTSDDSGSIVNTNLYLSTPTETNLLVSEPGPADHAGYVIDVSSWLDQALSSGTLVLTAEAVDASGKQGQSTDVVIGLDRVPPVATLTTSTTTMTESTLVTAEDATAGVTHIAMGRVDWIWEGEDFEAEKPGGVPIGRVVSDAAALNGLARKATVVDDPAGKWFFEEIELPKPGLYRAYFRVKADSIDLASEIAELQIRDQPSGELIGLRRLRGVDFRQWNTYQEFHVDFDLSAGIVGPAAFVVNFLDKTDIRLDRVIVVETPVAFTSTPSYDWSNFRLKVIDGAGNVADDLLIQSPYKTYVPVIIKPAED